ncbi:MAG: PAS domain S-box protein [Acidobacteriia bacterium]|nr:PAS domain S-box protein [Terriglobia bacterium]
MTEEMRARKNFKDDILREQVRLTFQHLPTMQLASFVVALVISYLVRGIVPHANIWDWLLMIVLVVASRIVLYYRFRKLWEGPFAGEYWKNLYVILAVVSGFVWGLSAFIIFPAHNLEYISLFVLVIASLSAATTISHSASRFAPAAWAIPALLFYAIRCLMEGGEPEYTIAFLIIVYLITILRFSFTQNRIITAAISLRFENLGLLEEVKKANEILSQDNTERKRAAETTSRLAAIVESSDDAIIGKTLEGIITSWNVGAERLYGYAKEEAVGRPFSFIIPPGFPDDLSMILDKIRQGNRVDHYETVRKRKDGTVVNVSLSVSPIRDSSGRTIGASAIAHDITERKRAEEEREKLIGELREALSKVKTLSGLLPICSSCKKIRDDRGYWNQIEGYIRSHAEVEFSHGICPDCMKKLYSDFQGGGLKGNSLF